MTIDYICKVVAKIRRKYDETDPLRLAKAMGIIVSFVPMGLDQKSCKGFFTYQSRKKHITINSDLPLEIQRIILMHEIGHACLHKERLAVIREFHEFSLYDTAPLEYEANLFAAEALLDDESVIEVLNDDDFFFSAAKTLYVPPEMLDFKFRILKAKGYQIEAPILANSNFLKDITKRSEY